MKTGLLGAGEWLKYAGECVYDTASLPYHFLSPDNTHHSRITGSPVHKTSTRRVDRRQHGSQLRQTHFVSLPLWLQPMAS